MRAALLLTAVALGAGAMSTSADAACNARGEFCDFPYWASNAFAGRERVPESSIDTWAERPVRAKRYYGYRQGYRAR